MSERHEQDRQEAVANIKRREERIARQRQARFDDANRLGRNDATVAEVRSRSLWDRLVG